MRRCPHCGVDLSLTNREYELIGILSSHPKGMKRYDLAIALGVAPSTVMVMVHRIRSKWGPNAVVSLRDTYRLP